MGDNIDDNNVVAQTQKAVLLQQMQQEIQQLKAQQQAQHRAIGEVDTPHTYYQNRAAICPPEPARHDFEIKPQMISLVKQHLFHGLPAENPMEHIETFEEICSTSKPNGVPPGYLKCKLFRHSLADKADRWLKSLPPRTLTTWPEVRACFLDHFFTKSKTALLKNRITSFEQYSGESFCEAWERFKEYRRECPHHGYSEEQLLSTFYDGVEWDYKHALNAASNGDFMIKSIAGANKLIENLAASSNNRCPEYERSKHDSGSGESQRLDDLNAKVELLLKANQRGVH
ncbi:hypothetical protein V5N11_026910 [Cardamine amara subsp. amara]|uniref:Retrotransposon gag domain-containing protein n=1 Tax=Cardamine amara subsp. amara TaxID=228776 RepID=A0ABD1AHE1_CARAN